MCLFIAHFVHLTVVGKLLLEHIFSLFCCSSSQNSLGEGVRLFAVQGQHGSIANLYKIFYCNTHLPQQQAFYSLGQLHPFRFCKVLLPNKYVFNRPLILILLIYSFQTKVSNSLQSNVQFLLFSKHSCSSWHEVLFQCGCSSSCYWAPSKTQAGIPPGYVFLPSYNSCQSLLPSIHLSCYMHRSRTLP